MKQISKLLFIEIVCFLKKKKNSCLPMGCFLLRTHLVLLWKPPSESIHINMPDYYIF